jgi:protein tyrosine/serine phosphatase
MKLFFFASIISSFLLLSVAPAFAQSGEVAPIKEYHEIVPGLTRGARPTLEGLKYLARNGVKTILNLENDSKQVAWETAEAAKLGMTVISTPMSGFWKPKTKQVNQSLQILADSRYYPLFVHCQHGQDRTGLISGLFRVIYQNWEPSVAYDEMLDNGFHPILFLLDQYFIDKTGYNPHAQQQFYFYGG